MSPLNTSVFHGAVDEDTEGSECERGAWTVSVTEAAAILARERGLSLRQAYRYVESARTIARALPVGEPSVAATFKIPRDVLAQLRASSASSGLSLSAIVTRALKRCLTSTGQRRRHG
jgi:hypothetical protein